MAFKWAQSLHEIHLFAKFAHKLDAPAENDVDGNVNVTISERGLEVRAASGRRAKRFVLEIELLRDLDAAQSSWSVAAFGVTVTLRKAARGRWKRLLKSKQPMKQAHTWWEKDAEYEGEEERFEEAERAWLYASPDRCEMCRLTLEVPSREPAPDREREPASASQARRKPPSRPRPPALEFVTVWTAQPPIKPLARGRVRSLSHSKQYNNTSSLRRAAGGGGVLRGDTTAQPGGGIFRRRAQPAGGD